MLVRIPKNRDDVVTLKPGFAFNDPTAFVFVQSLPDGFEFDSDGRVVHNPQPTEEEIRVSMVMQMNRGLAASLSDIQASTSKLLNLVEVDKESE